MEGHRVARRRGSCIFEKVDSDGGDAVSFTRRPPFTTGKIPGTHFC
jgi:hypothetical protein